jgi:dienelactone hydrolase
VTGVRFEERHIRVPRSARYVVLGREAEPPSWVWFVVHGYRQLARGFAEAFEPFAHTGRCFVAPEALNRFYLDEGPGRHGPEARVGATWMTRVDREAEIRDYVGYLDRLRREVLADLGGSPAVGVLGFSQGVHTAARWVAYGEEPPPDRTVLWSAYLPPDLDLASGGDRLRATELWLVGGSGDRLRRADLEKAQAERLERHAIPHRMEWFDGGHEFDDALLERVLSQNSPSSSTSGSSS